MCFLATLNTYAEVDPDAKRAAADKIEESFDIDLTSVFGNIGAKPDPQPGALTFTVEQLELMLAEARRLEREADGYTPRAS